jgi:hypothetical protein
MMLPYCQTALLVLPYVLRVWVVKMTKRHTGWRFAPHFQLWDVALIRWPGCLQYGKRSLLQSTPIVEGVQAMCCLHQLHCYPVMK